MLQFRIFFSLLFIGYHAGAQVNLASWDTLTRRINTYVNTYGAFKTHSLLDTTWFAQNIFDDVRSGRNQYHYARHTINSLWPEKERKSMFSHTRKQSPLWHAEWYLYEEGDPNKKDFKKLLPFFKKYLVHEKSNGVHYTEIYASRHYSNLTGTLFAALSLNQLEWPYNIRKHEGHFFIEFWVKGRTYIIDSSFLNKIWRVDKRNDDYIQFLNSIGLLKSEQPISELLKNSQIIEYDHLLGIQKRAEAKQLMNDSLQQAFLRMEVAYNLYPTIEFKQSFLEYSKAYAHSDEQACWFKTYAMLKFIELSGDRSQSTIDLFNAILGDAMIFYDENEELELGDPASMGVRMENSYFSKDVPQKNSLNIIAGFNYDEFVGFPLVDRHTRGLYHTLNYQSSSSLRSKDDVQFYVDAMYNLVMLDTALMEDIYSLNLKGYPYFSSPIDIFEDHLEHSIITESDWHFMCTIFYLSYLEHNVSRTTDETRNPTMSTLYHGVFIDELIKHLPFVENSFLLERAKIFVRTMIPMEANSLMGLRLKNLKKIARIVGIEKEFQGVGHRPPYMDLLER